MQLRNFDVIYAFQCSHGVIGSSVVVIINLAGRIIAGRRDGFVSVCTTTKPLLRRRQRRPRPQRQAATAGARDAYGGGGDDVGRFLFSVASTTFYCTRTTTTSAAAAADDDPAATGARSYCTAIITHNIIIIRVSQVWTFTHGEDNDNSVLLLLVLIFLYNRNNVLDDFVTIIYWISKFLSFFLFFIQRN